MRIFVGIKDLITMIRTNPPSSKTLTLSLLIFIGGGTLWFTYPSMAVYAVAAMITGYAILVGGSVLRGV